MLWTQPLLVRKKTIKKIAIKTTFIKFKIPEKISILSNFFLFEFGIQFRHHFSNFLLIYCFFADMEAE